MKEMLKKLTLGVTATFMVALTVVGIFGTTPALAAAASDTGTPCEGAAWDGTNLKVNMTKAKNANTCSACIGSAIANGTARATKDASGGTTKYAEQDGLEHCNGTSGATLKVDDIWGNVRTVINWILIAVGLVCVVFIIFGGIRYAVSGGESEKVKNAKNTLLYAIIGLAVALLAGVIVNIVFNAIGTFDPSVAPSSS